MAQNNRRNSKLNLLRIGIVLIVCTLIGACADSRLRQYNSALLQLGERNYAAALETLQQLAEAGFAPAQFRLGLMHLNGFGVPQNLPLAGQWLIKAAQQDDVAGQYTLALLYSKGIGVERDRAQALYWLERLALQNYAPAQFEVGMMYANGVGTQRDDAAAVKWLRQGGENQHPKAIQAMVKAYQEGLLGLPQDAAQAQAWQDKTKRKYF